VFNRMFDDIGRLLHGLAAQGQRRRPSPGSRTGGSAIRGLKPLRHEQKLDPPLHEGMQRLLQTSDPAASGADGVAQPPHECLLLPTFHRALDVERSDALGRRSLAPTARCDRRGALEDRDEATR
jgi:hypothetical protein